ncbi:hypothetical protein SAMN04488128_103759 [Chitinophaga eiseniae]|uniref:Conjugal transfer protein TraD n=1 Tax=Chitinophaga eiseniae TaxID=634771 RepID=A0A1T4SYQ7_9BACT|nr:hypothetical protein [Chitinophaga eiseniae]SKA33058.1 hypothetical protein SAMN04488128_103759 [Chitinophaga eiseniae]
MILEILILLCLLVVIFLLLQDRVTTLKTGRQSEPAAYQQPPLPDIMGTAKVANRQEPPNEAIQRQSEIPSRDTATFDTDPNEDYFVDVVPQEELDEIFGPEVDLDEEEAEWRLDVQPEGQDGLATGVTFEELSLLGSVLRQQSSSSAREEQVAGIAYRIQGTDLLALMVESIDNASERIAEMLDKHLAQETDSSSSIMRSYDSNAFDINNFI